MEWWNGGMICQEDPPNEMCVEKPATVRDETARTSFAGNPGLNDCGSWENCSDSPHTSTTALVDFQRYFVKSQKHGLKACFVAVQSALLE